MLELIPVLIIIGIGAGAFGAVLGVGGGIIIVPVLTYLGLSPTQTSSTSLFAVLSTSAGSTVEYSRQKRIEYGLALRLAAIAAPGAVIGALLSRQFTPELFKLYFGILIIMTGLYILDRKSVLNERFRIRTGFKNVFIYTCGFAAGILSSLFGVGGGIIFVPIMLILLGIDMHRAAPTSQLILFISSLVGIATHSYLGHPDYLYAAALAAGAFIGAQIGARISKRAKGILLERILGIALIGVGVKLILDWFPKPV